MYYENEDEDIYVDVTKPKIKLLLSLYYQQNV